MKLSDVQKRLQAPFPAHMLIWKAAAFSQDNTRALMVAVTNVFAVQTRLDAICPDSWAFAAYPAEGTPRPAVRGSLTVLGMTREDIGEGGTFAEATEDALRRCACHFGIGRYLYDLPKQWLVWDNTLGKVVGDLPELPEWARPDHEKSPAGAHLVMALEQLRYELPEDLDTQRAVYKHLKAALGTLHVPVTPD
jgi:hypothetical protein